MGASCLALEFFGNSTFRLALAINFYKSLQVWTTGGEQACFNILCSKRYWHLQNMFNHYEKRDVESLYIYLFSWEEVDIEIRWTRGCFNFTIHYNPIRCMHLLELYVNAMSVFISWFQNIMLDKSINQSSRRKPTHAFNKDNIEGNINMWFFQRKTQCCILT